MSECQLEFPNEWNVYEELHNTKLDVDLSELNNKLYEDPFYSQENNPVKVNAVSFRGDFNLETYKTSKGEYAVRITDNKSGNIIKFYLDSLVEQQTFVRKFHPYDEFTSDGLMQFDVLGEVNKNALRKRTKLQKILRNPELIL